jgi:hypothetical protein
MYDETEMVAGMMSVTLRGLNTLGIALPTETRETFQGAEADENIGPVVLSGGFLKGFMSRR